MVRAEGSLLACLFLLSFQVSANPQFVLDLLSPYEDGYHGSLHRSVRSVAECQSDGWGDGTFDKYDLLIPVPKSANLPYGVHRFADKVESNLQNVYSIHRKRYLMGSIAVLQEPYYTLSVLEPVKPGGCQVKYYSASRATVRNTAHNRVNGCAVAINAGYFGVRNGRCLGNLVSDGRIVQVSNEMNANFGIRHDGSVVVGYISAEEVRNGSFRQLVSGVIWLVRNGSNYVNESMQVECAANQDTGKMATFVNVLSARTAVGIDKQGKIIVAHVDGQTHARGANLYEFADLLINHGVVSAINLDGGGSSTFLHKDVLINYPSDHCRDNPAYRCERRVSTVLCIHEVQCLEPTCNNHGNCTNGRCICYPPWTGIDCGQLNCATEKCSGRGNCSNGYCSCDAGWGGARCNEECSSGTYGSGCKSKCRCYGRSICDKHTGKCLCPPGYVGYACWTKCLPGLYGDRCSLRCPFHNCSGHGTCSNVDGSCLCAGNWTGTKCNETSGFGPASTSSINVSTTLTLQPSVVTSIYGEKVTAITNTSSPSSTADSMNLCPQTSATPLPATKDQPRRSDHQCSTNTVESGTSTNSWPYKYLLLGALASLGISITVHVIICMKMSTARTKQFNMNTLLTRRKRRRRRKRTEVPQCSSSSDCSI